MRKIIQITFVDTSQIIGLANDGTLWKLMYKRDEDGKWVKLDIDESDLRWMKDETN
jgi:hypothetical protein